MKLVPIAMSLALLSGCSSIISKSEYSVAVNSDPDGAEFVVANRAGQKVHSGRTPASVTLKSSSGYFKREQYTITLTKEGYAQKTFTVSSSVDGWYFGNILFGGLIGMLIVDPATGAMYNLPDRVDIPLDATVTTSAPDQVSSIADTLTIATLDSLTPEQIARLEPIN